MPYILLAKLAGEQGRNCRRYETSATTFSVETQTYGGTEGTATVQVTRACRDWLSDGVQGPHQSMLE